MLFIRLLILFIIRKINAVQHVVPFYIIKIHNLVFRHFQYVDYCSFNRLQTIIRAYRAPNRSMDILRLWHALCRLPGEPVIAFEIVLCHVPEVELHVYALVEYPAAMLEHKQRLVVLPGVKANGIPCHTLNLRILCCPYYTIS